MKVIYIAGPHRAKTEFEVAENIRRAEALAVAVWRAGAAAICPHKNSAFLGGAVPDHVFLGGDLEILRRCDALICTENWRTSAGACDEVALMNRLGKPVFESLGELTAWIVKESEF